MKLNIRNEHRQATKPKADSLKRSIKFINLSPGKLRKMREDINH